MSPDGGPSMITVAGGTLPLGDQVARIVEQMIGRRRIECEISVSVPASSSNVSCQHFAVVLRDVKFWHGRLSSAGSRPVRWPP